MIVTAVVIELVLRTAFTIFAVSAGPDCTQRSADFKRLHLAYRLLLRPVDEIPSRHWVHDPYRGHKLAPGLSGLPRYGSELSSNSIGARGRREVAVPRPEGTTRIVALGDSFTFGERVGDKHTWPAQLERLLVDTEVVNLGGSAYAHDQMYLALIDDGLRLEPDIVVLGFVADDLRRNMTSFFCYEKPRYIKKNGVWEIDNVPVPTPEEVRNTHLVSPLVVEIPRLAFEGLMARRRESPSELEVAQYILSEVKARCDESGSRLILVSIPFLDESMITPRHRPFDQLCESIGLECVDTAPTFAELVKRLGGRAVVERYRLPGDHHYSAAGYTVIADSLRGHLLGAP